MSTTIEVTDKETGSRIAELLNVLQDAEAVSYRFDIDDEGPEARAARITADRVVEELGAVVPTTSADALAAIRFVRKMITKDLAGIELGTEEIATLNLLDGLSEFIHSLPQER